VLLLSQEHGGEYGKKERPMLVLHTWTTPNGKKVPILLEELGLAHEIHFVNVGKGEQFEPEFLAISPNNKIPALVDHGAEGGPLLSSRAARS
jgi:GST-like protein